MKWIVYILLVCYFVMSCFSLNESPYKILGIRKSANSVEIRKAYKQLAVEWHPDKNKSPGAGDKFVQITEAYELLNDPERRRIYDTLGQITEASKPRANYKRHDQMDDDFLGTKYRFYRKDVSTFQKLSISARAFENIAIPKSFKTPYLLFFYSNWCFSCLEVEPIWKRVIEELEPLGVSMATVHTENEPGLAKKVGIHKLPCLAILVDGRSSIYKESMFSVQKIVEFVRNKLPYRMVTQVNDYSIDDFLSGWSDNKVRGLIFQKSEPIRLRYLLSMFYHRDRLTFGFVLTSSSDTEGLRKRYQVQKDKDTLLLFNEYTERPVASISMSDIPVHALQDVIEKNKYLLLPRLSSQAILDALCPPAWVNRHRKRLCVLLVSQNTPHHDIYRNSMRKMAQESNFKPDRVRFMYLYQETQADFVHALTSSGRDSPEEPALNVVILCRRDTNRISYEWLTGKIDWSASYNETKERLELAIERILKASQALPNEAVVEALIDEHAQSMMMKILNRVLMTYDSLRASLGKEHVLPAVSVVATLIVMVVIGLVLSHVVKLEETKVQEQRMYNRMKKESSKGSGDLNGDDLLAKQVQRPELKLHELRGETYNGLVHLLKPGCRTIVLLVDLQSRVKLLTKFHKIVWPYRKNKTLMFAHLNLDRHLSWYAKLLALSLPEEKELKINPRNCVGTVLALNGLKKYFSMYHAKHPECMGTKGTRRMARMTRTIGGSTSSMITANFIGFNGDSDDSYLSDDSDVEQGYHVLNDQSSSGADKYSQVIMEENLLDALPNWLDRLFEGTAYRYYINYWPDFTGK